MHILLFQLVRNLHICFMDDFSVSMKFQWTFNEVLNAINLSSLLHKVKHVSITRSALSLIQKKYTHVQANIIQRKQYFFPTFDRVYFICDTFNNCKSSFHYCLLAMKSPWPTKCGWKTTNSIAWWAMTDVLQYFILNTRAHIHTYNINCESHYIMFQKTFGTRKSTFTANTRPSAMESTEI